MKARFLSYWKSLPRWVCLVVLLPLGLFPLTGCTEQMEPDGQKSAALLLSAATTMKIADGVVYGTGVGTNIWATQRVLSSAPNAFAIMDATKTYVIFATPTANMGNGNYSWWFALADMRKFQLTSQAIARLPQFGNMANNSTFSGLVNTADRMGWKVTSAKDLPWGFRLSLQSAITWLATSCGQALTDFLVVPIFSVDGWKEPLIKYLPTDS